MNEWQDIRALHQIRRPPQPAAADSVAICLPCLSDRILLCEKSIVVESTGLLLNMGKETPGDGLDCTEFELPCADAAALPE